MNIPGAHPQMVNNECANFQKNPCTHFLEHAWTKFRPHRGTVRQTDRWKPIYSPNSFAGGMIRAGIKSFQN